MPDAWNCFIKKKELNIERCEKADSTCELISHAISSAYFKYIALNTKLYWYWYVYLLLILWITYANGRNIN